MDPARYGLTDADAKHNIDGMVWTRPVGVADAAPEAWMLAQITVHLWRIYIERIAYEYMHCPRKTERLLFPHLFEGEPAEARRTGAKRQRRIHELLAYSAVFDQPGRALLVFGTGYVVLHALVFRFLRVHVETSWRGTVTV